MTTKKQPQDFKKKGKEPFSFEYDGETYTFDKPITVGVVRRHRHLSEEEAVFAVLEEVAGDEVLEVVDGMDMSEFAEFWVAAMGATPGES